MHEHETDELDVESLLGWGEFCAWAVLAMTPIIWWLQGPSVSNDQFVVRTALVAISGVTAASLRGWEVLKKMRDRRRDSGGNERVGISGRQ